MIRPADARDAAAIAPVYAPFVTGTVITFETEPPTPATIVERMAEAARFPWLVAEEDGDVIGYACATSWRSRAAYAWVAETSIYLASGAQGRGLGRALYAALLESLAARGFVAAIGCLTLPNPASVALHEAMGFAFVGRHPKVGYKFGAWHDVGFWQKELGERPNVPLSLP